MPMSISDPDRQVWKAPERAGSLGGPLSGSAQLGDRRQPQTARRQWHSGPAHRVYLDDRGWSWVRVVMWGQFVCAEGLDPPPLLRYSLVMVAYWVRARQRVGYMHGLSASSCRELHTAPTRTRSWVSVKPETGHAHNDVARRGKGKRRWHSIDLH
jgi:hypothetical protein